MTDPWVSEIEFSHELARELIESQFPLLARAKVEAFGQGWDNVALLVNDEWVFRFPQRDLAGDLIGYENACLLEVGARLPLAVPIPVFVGKPQEERYPYGFSGYRLLSGATACSVELSDEDRAASAERLGHFLSCLHGAQIDEGLASTVPGDLIRRTDLPYRKKMLLERLDELEGMGETFDYQALRRVVTDLAEASSWSKTPCLVHGDLYARHLIVDSANSVTGIIDWGDVHRGDPALDLSLAYVFLPEAARGAFFNAYGDVDLDTHRRARFRGLLSAATLVTYGAKVGDNDIARAGRWGLANAPLN
ncbi:MAG: aminoglycoside phosphotransferase (APT) family kinase protein [Planctomycetota bacterium]|jgi:aminoglycoside phosphotransferase (APT) family kinase protein